MAGFLKKALGIFVEFDEDSTTGNSPESTSQGSGGSGSLGNMLNQAETEKFEKYFDNLFDKANLPGPDYFEFFKMMETLEAHIHDEKARLAATFASLSIQGLTKHTLLETAGKYKEIIEKDHYDFELAFQEKLKAEVGQRQMEIGELEEGIVSRSEQIQKLTKEISEAQVKMGQIKGEVTEAENKLSRNNNGYQLASKAITAKIARDIQKIQTNL